MVEASQKSRKRRSHKRSHGVGGRSQYDGSGETDGAGKITRKALPNASSITDRRGRHEGVADQPGISPLA
jgi:hypothetical protein